MREVRTLMLSNLCVEELFSENDGRLDRIWKELDNHPKIQSILSYSNDDAPVTFNIKNIEIDNSGTGYISIYYTIHKYSDVRKKIGRG